MECGTSGLAGAPAPPPAPMAPCRGQGSATAPRTEAQSAEESGWRLWTASLGTAQVQYMIVTEIGDRERFLQKQKYTLVIEIE